ncbi:S-adenosyl-L-methionine-dependent methyltransferase [Acephala macrosclerotiorum]|nr:S-adenosyl-L-methionine-dependent methyltransferase [Acephala macrosclerotiorum]
MAYQQGLIKADDPNITKLYGERTSQVSCQYLLPHISKTANILDVGCGPGTITVDLAKIASEGQTTGVDNSEGIVKQASTSFSDVPNLKFQVGDATDLKNFADNSFDIVHAHALLVHISDPVKVLKEFYRVCKPGGIIACRENSPSVVLSLKPDLPGIRGYWDRALLMIPKMGGHPGAGRDLEKWAKEVGFEADGGKVVVSTGRFWSPSHLDQVSGLAAEQAVKYGIATKEELDTWAKAFEEWGLLRGTSSCLKLARSSAGKAHSGVLDGNQKTSLDSVVLDVNSSVAMFHPTLHFLFPWSSHSREIEF